ncbi:YsnF/AvaK domain-containing protein, partial [Streptomyces rhizosphaericus]|uniref:YsnF/AvaK domain-containing protein n=1 Tax=Streptomyces rhizosphaericus TaxID=114699 RepID=UPI0031E1119D
LHVGTEKVATGKARLRKYVVTENVTKTVPVTREEVRLEREPITDANAGDALSGGDLPSEEHEVTLHEERVVTNKETVPVERVKVDTDTVTEERQVDEQVRHEEIVLDDDATDGRTTGSADQR